MRLDDSSFIVGSMKMYGCNGVLLLEYRLYGLEIGDVLGCSSFGGEREIGRRYSFSLESKSMCDNDSTYTVFKIVGGLVNCSLDEDWTDS